MRVLLIVSLIVVAWPSFHVRQAVAQATTPVRTCADIDPASGGAPADGVVEVNLDLLPGDTVVLDGVGELVVVTPADGLTTIADIQNELRNGPEEPTNTFVAVIAGIHYFFGRQPGTTAGIEGTFTCTPGPATVETNKVTQQITSTTVMTQQAGQNIYAGIGAAIAERFFAPVPARPQVVVKGYTASAYVSLFGVGAVAEDIRARRLAMYSAGTDDPLAAIEAAFGAVDADQETVTENASSFTDLSPIGLDRTPFPLEDPYRVNVWARGSLTHFDGDSFTGNTWNGIVGIDYLVTDRVLVGVLGGYENGDFTFERSFNAFDGTGVTAGTYVGVRWSDSLLMEAFLTHSWLDYNNAFGAATGSTDASRVLVSVNLTGQYDISDSFILEPNVRAFYAHERQDPYTLGNGQTITGNTIDSGRISFGPRLRYLTVDGFGTNWSLFLSAHGEYDLSSEEQISTTLPDFDELLSARVGGGFDARLSNGWSISLDCDIGGIGSGTFLSYSGTGKIRIPLY